MPLTVNNKLELSKEVDNKIQCLLCPHGCILKEGKAGKCRVRKNNGKEIELTNYGIISTMAVEPIEKKPFKHFLKESRTLSLGGNSCSLFCKFCENHELSQTNNIKGERLYLHNIISTAKDKDCQSISMSYNEPTLSFEFLINLADMCVIHDLPFLLKTNAFINKEPWKEICLKTSAINIDWKGSKEKFKFITGVNSYVLQERIKEAYNYGVHLEISIPLYYKDDELEDEMKIVGKFLSSIDKEIPCHLLSIQAAYKYSDFVFNPENIDKAKNILSKYMDNIHIVV